MDAKLERLEARLTQALTHQETRLIRWMFGFWIWVALAGTLIALQRVR